MEPTAGMSEIQLLENVALNGPNFKQNPKEIEDFCKAAKVNVPKNRDEIGYSYSTYFLLRGYILKKRSKRLRKHIRNVL